VRAGPVILRPTRDEAELLGETEAEWTLLCRHATRQATSPGPGHLAYSDEPGERPSALGNDPTVSDKSENLFYDI